VECPLTQVKSTFLGKVQCRGAFFLIPLSRGSLPGVLSSFAPPLRSLRWCGYHGEDPSGCLVGLSQKAVSRPHGRCLDCPRGSGNLKNHKVWILLSERQSWGEFSIDQWRLVCSSEAASPRLRLPCQHPGSPEWLQQLRKVFSFIQLLSSRSLSFAVHGLAPVRLQRKARGLGRDFSCWHMAQEFSLLTHK
jgi:hypothetical protein